MELIKKHQRKLVWGILAFAFIQGLVYVFLFPPWQHYDEPTHFEVAWMIANWGKIPKEGDYDDGMRREVAESLITHGFYEGKEHMIPDLDNLPYRFEGFAYFQTSDMPGFYLLTAIPAKLLQNQPVETQLYAMRLISLGFFMVSVFATLKIMGLLYGKDHPLTYMIPLTMAMIPAFVDVMTQMNNDAAGVGIMALFLWVAVDILKLGLNWKKAALMVGVAVIGVISKLVLIITLPLSILILAFAILREEKRKYVWIVLAGILVLVVSASVTIDAKYWFRNAKDQGLLRVKHDDAVLGEYVIELNGDAEASPSWMKPAYGTMPPSSVVNLDGEILTFGVWMWTENVIQEGGIPGVLLPRVVQMKNQKTQRVSLTNQPTFYAFQMVAATVPQRMWIALDPGSAVEGITVNYDGFILAKGEYPVNQEPIYKDNGLTGTWGEERFDNLIRNPSAEKGWISVRPMVDNLAARFMPNNMRPAILMQSLFDLESSGWYYKAALINITRSFWAKFSWSQVGFIHGKPYRYLGLFSLVGTLIGGYHIVQRRKTFGEDVILVFGIAMVFVWSLTLMRGVTYLFIPSHLIPVARYGAPAIIPTVWLLVGGWSEIGEWVTKLRFPRWLLGMVYIVGFLILDVTALLRIYTYFYM